MLCKFPEIRDQAFFEKENTVIIKVVCCSPHKIREKLICKGSKTIKSIENIVPEKPKPPPEKPPPPPNQRREKPSPHRRSQKSRRSQNPRRRSQKSLRSQNPCRRSQKSLRSPSLRIRQNMRILQNMWKSHQLRLQNM